MSANTMMKNFKISDDDWFDVVKTPKSKVKFQVYLRALSNTIELSGASGFDFACGEGTFVRILREKGATVEGCDISDDLVPKDDPLLHVGGIEYLSSVASSSKDFFVATQIISLIDDKDRATLLREASRILKPGGALLIGTANKWMLPPGRKITFDPYTFNEYLLEFGLEEVRQDFYNCLRQWYFRILPKNRGWTYDLNICDNLPTEFKKKKCTAYVSVSVKS